MTDRLIVRGDTYVLRRQVFRLALVDEDLEPLNMTSSTIRSTFKTVPTNPNTDPTDTGAPLKCEITFDAFGDIIGTPEHFALPPGGTAADGILYLVADATTTLGLPLATALNSDVQVTDPNGEVLTVFSLWTLTTRDGYTNES